MTADGVPVPGPDLAQLDENAIADYVVRQRWFGAKTQEVAQATIVDAVRLGTEPSLVLALVEMRFQGGTHEIYQLPLGLRAEESAPKATVATGGGWCAYDALTDPSLVGVLLSRARVSPGEAVHNGPVRFETLLPEALPSGDVRVRPIVAEQSNSSVVVDESVVLKVYRRIEAGPNPELELLAFLAESEFGNVPALYGSIGYAGELMEATLGILQEHVESDGDGWGLALDALRGDADSFLPRLHRLGEVTGELHAALARSTDPAFSPEEPGPEALALLTATVDGELEQTFRDLPEEPPFEPLTGSAQAAHDLVQDLAHARSLGRTVRHHGDYHLGQVLWSAGDWTVIDFEGEPARSLAERRRKRSALRDVAGMLRSISYACAVAAREGTPPPDGWEERARSTLLDGYLPVADAAGLLPATAEAVGRLLAIFELQKAVYELRYERESRPDWVEIPVAAIRRLLDAAQPA